MAAEWSESGSSIPLDIFEGEIGDEEIDQLALIDKFDIAYQRLAGGLNQEVNESGEQDLFWVSLVGRPGSHTETPVYIQQYHETAENVYDDLLRAAINTGDHEPLLSLIFTYKESDLARRYLGQYNMRYWPEYGAVVGDASVVMQEIKSMNNLIDTMRLGAMHFAQNSAKKKHLSELREKLNDDRTGLLGSIAVGLKFRLARGKKGSVKEMVIKPLKKIADLPSVPEQLAAKELAGQPLIDLANPED